jgi:hypothetical protein
MQQRAVAVTGPGLKLAEVGQQPAAAEVAGVVDHGFDPQCPGVGDLVPQPSPHARTKNVPHLLDAAVATKVCSVGWFARWLVLVLIPARRRGLLLPSQSLNDACKLTPFRKGCRAWR